MSEKPQECCPTDIEPKNIPYHPKGSFVKFHDLEIYVTGESTSHGIIVLPDIFGSHLNTIRFIDELASRGFTIALPDVFHGAAMKELPSDRSLIMAWVHKYGTWDIVKDDVNKTFDFLSKEKGVSSINVLGLCWGGRYALQLAHDARFNRLGSAHPSILQEDDAKKAERPVIMLLSKDEDKVALSPIEEGLKQSPAASKHIWERFDDVPHGWCGARCDWNDELTRTRALEAADKFTKFYQQTD